MARGEMVRRRGGKRRDDMGPDGKGVRWQGGQMARGPDGKGARARLFYCWSIMLCTVG